MNRNVASFRAMTLRRYLTATREPRYSVVFALPLLALYELLVFLLPTPSLRGVRNGADVLLKTAFVAVGGIHGLAMFSLVLLGGAVWLVLRDRRRHPGPLESRVFGGMLAESVVWALLLGAVVAWLTGLLLRPPLLLQTAAEPIPLSLGAHLVLSLGAGIYEELLFRVLLVGGLLAGGLALGWKRPVAVAVAVIGSALIFSGFHYVGPLGDTWTLQSFTFRAIAGLMLSGLYVARGFGIVAWSHALYDMFLNVAV